jgi:DNA polymerase-3 subunit alpha
MTEFVSLHNQTSSSILDSLIEPKDLFKRAKELGWPAVGITDHNSLGAAWDALKASNQTGVKLIIGCECYFADDAKNITDKLRHVVFLAKNAIGYKNLLTLNKLGFDQGFFIGKRIYSVVDWNLLEKHTDGLICLTACGNGIINQLLMNKKFDAAENTIVKLKELFGDNLGLEIQANNMKRGSNIFNDEIDQQFLNRRNIELGKKHNIKVVPTCNAHYLKKEDNETHDVFLAIGAHQPIFSNYRLRYPVSDFYMKSGDEVKSFFVRNYGEELAEQLCANTVYFANLCEKPDWIDPKFSNPSGKELPIFPVKDELDYLDFRNWIPNQSSEVLKLDEDKQFLRYRALTAFDKLKEKDSSYIQHEKIYLDRIYEEFDVLEHHGFSSYLLIVADYTNWCVRNNIPTGPGRGSVGGCFLAFLLGIHEADSIKYDLLFARFHNRDKQSFPDIDQDISGYHREKVISYLRNKYGNDYVCSVSNFNTITPKVYVRDISRALELGGSRDDAVKIGNDIADCIPSEIHSIQEAFNKIPLFFEYCKKYPELLKYADINGKYRAMSKHAGAIVIGLRPLVGLVPLRMDKDQNLCIEYEKNNTEENGLVKMDILGLSTLDDISKIIKLIHQSGKTIGNEYKNYEANDEKTYDLISKGDTFKVFQLGASGGTIELCKRIKPKNIEDLAIITTLARPAAANIRNDFISTRDGKKSVILLHKSLEGAFKKTYGFGLFDESILQLGKDVAGWDLNEADKIRKMIKDKGKNPDKDKKLRSDFIKSAIANNKIEPILATRIWDEEIKKFASYTFNKSHAVMYSFLSYQTAYLKAHFPVEFLLANLMAEVSSNSQDARANIDKIKKEMRAHKIKLIAPDINTSELTYTLLDNKRLLTGLDALKFVGDDAIRDIIEKRPFKSFFDFMSRVNSKKVRANSIQALIASGCMDSFKIPRKMLFLYTSDYRKKLQVWMKKHDPTKEEFVYPWPKEPDWRLSELYALEHFYLGEAFVCKPTSAYGDFFKDSHSMIYDIRTAQDKTRIAPVKCIIRSFFEFRVKKEGSKYYGQSMIKATIEDKNGDQCSCTIFPDKWQIVQERIKQLNSKAKFEAGIAISFGGTTNDYEDTVGIILNDFFDISMIPSLPIDLKAKKINLKETRAKLAEEAQKNGEIKNVLETIEEDMYQEGLLDFENEVDLD